MKEGKQPGTRGARFRCSLMMPHIERERASGIFISFSPANAIGAVICITERQGGGGKRDTFIIQIDIDYER